MNKQLEQYAQIVWEPDDLIEIRPLQPWAGKRVWTKAEDLPKHYERMARENEAGANIFAGILPRDRDGGGTAEDVSGGHVLWADFDHCEPGDVDSIISGLKLPEPSMVVDSGHGAHVFWRMKERQTKAVIVELVGNLVSFLLEQPEAQNYIDKSAKDPARILRLPGYVNHKPPAAAASILYARQERRYEPSDFAMVAVCRLPEKPKERPIIPIWRKTDTIERGRRYISTIGGSAPGGRTTTAFKVACVLHNDFEISAADTLQLLQGWDQASNTPTIEHDYGPEELCKILKNAAKYHKKQPGSLKNTEKRPVNASELDGVDISGILSMEAKESQEGAFPARFFDVPGLIGEVMSHNLATAPKPQPVLALAGAIALQAVLCARKSTDEKGSTPNLYICGVAESGAGKDHARQLNKQILFQAGMQAHQAEGIKSGSGLINALIREPSLLFQLDEYGRFIKTANAGGHTNPHIYEIITKLLGLYSSANTIYESDRYADVEAGGKQVVRPHAIIYGTTVPRSLYEGLTEESITDGFLSRTLIFDVDDHNPRRKIRKMVKIPTNIIEIAKWWGEFTPPGSGDLHPEPHVVPITSEAASIAERFIDVEHSEQGGLKGSPLVGLWSRTAQNADKLALIYACSKSPESPIIDAEATNWGYDLSEWLTRRMLGLIGDNVADNLFHGQCLKLKRILKKKGGKINRSALVKAMKIKARELDEVLNSMIESGEVAATTTGEGRGAKTNYSVIE